MLACGSCALPFFVVTPCAVLCCALPRCVVLVATGMVQHEPLPHMLLHQAAVANAGAMHRQQQHLPRATMSRRLHARVRRVLLLERRHGKGSPRGLPARSGRTAVHDVESGKRHDRGTAGSYAADGSIAYPAPGRHAIAGSSGKVFVHAVTYVLHCGVLRCGACPGMGPCAELSSAMRELELAP